MGFNPVTDSRFCFIPWWTFFHLYFLIRWIDSKTSDTWNLTKVKQPLGTFKLKSLALKTVFHKKKKPTSKQTYWFSLNPFSGQRTWCNGRTTPKSFEFGIYNFTIFINSDLKRQDNIKFKLHAKWCHTGKQFLKLQYNYLSQSLVI